MGKVNKYSEEFKEKALKMLEEIGPNKTGKELGVANQTLYRWRAQRRKNGVPIVQNDAQSIQEPQPAEEVNKSVSIHEKAEPGDKTKTALDIPVQEDLLLDELERLKAENLRLQGTLCYLIDENKALLDRQQRYLEAIALLAH